MKILILISLGLLTGPLTWAQPAVPEIDLFFIEDEAKEALSQIPESLNYLKRF